MKPFSLLLSEKVWISSTEEMIVIFFCGPPQALSLGKEILAWVPILEKDFMCYIMQPSKV